MLADVVQVYNVEPMTGQHLIFILRVMRVG